MPKDLNTLLWFYTRGLWQNFMSKRMLEQVELVGSFS
jgi:hypothetical protein